MTHGQLPHAALLHVGRKGCLAARSGLEAHGFAGFADERIHVVHPRATTVPPMPGLVVHESRRLVSSHIVHRRGLATTTAARSAVDMAAWQRHPRFACTVLAAAV